MKQRKGTPYFWRDRGRARLDLRDISVCRHPKNGVPHVEPPDRERAHRGDIQSLDVKHSFLNAILHGREWMVHVRYADEPDSIYIYTAESGRIQAAGVAGSTDKDDLKHVE